MVMSDLCLLVLSGLPAAGKTLLTTTLQQYIEDVAGSSSPLVSVAVEYDKLMPSNVEQVLIECEDSQSAWKSYRENIVLCVDSVLSTIQTSRRDNVDLVLSQNPVGTIPQDMWVTFMDLMYKNLSENKRGSKICFIIDDNMYYTSMRYRYFQLARKYTVGFCQVHIQTDLENALLQNSRRILKVNEEVIVTMATRMEVPDKLKNNWEQYSLIFQRDKTKIVEIFSLIETSCENPVLPVEEEDTEEKQCCRLVCSESFLHQSDQILRKLVSQEMTAAKDQFSTKAELKSYASLIQICRKQLYDKLKTGSVCAPNDLVAMVTDSSKDTSSEMFKFLQDLFKSELIEINR